VCCMLRDSLVGLCCPVDAAISWRSPGVEIPQSRHKFRRFICYFLRRFEFDSRDPSRIFRDTRMRPDLSAGSAGRGQIASKLARNESLELLRNIDHDGYRRPLRLQGQPIVGPKRGRISDPVHLAAERPRPLPSNQVLQPPHRAAHSSSQLLASRPARSTRPWPPSRRAAGGAS